MKEDEALLFISGRTVHERRARIGGGRRWLAIAGLLASASAALAHPGHAEASGFMAGIGHPVGGLDHLIAMVAVGLWAAQMRERALWLVPSTFLVMMAAGGALGWSGVRLPFVEAGILASVVAFGLLIATAARFPTRWSMAVVGLFALFHGHAHGAEMPAAAAPLAYSAGFVLATGLLHLTGTCAGLLARRCGLPVWVFRFAGAFIVLAGACLWPA